MPLQPFPDLLYGGGAAVIVYDIGMRPIAL